MIMKELYSEGNTQNDLNKINRSVKQNENKSSLTEALEAIPQNMKHIIEQTTDTGVGAWLNYLTLKKQNLDLNKEQEALNITPFGQEENGHCCHPRYQGFFAFTHGRAVKKDFFSARPT